MTSPPADAPDAPTRLTSGDLEVDLRAREVVRGGRRLRLQDKPFEALAALLARPGEVVLREELQELLWPGRIVEFDNNLNTALAKLRRALGESPHAPRYVETLPRRGYRWLPPVTAVAAPPTAGARTPRRRRVALLAAAAAVAAAAALVATRPDGAPRPATEPAPAASAAAWAAYLRGRHDAEGGDAAGAVTAFEAAVAADPGFASAWVELADAHYRLHDAAALARSREAARRALELDPASAAAHHRLGSLALYLDRDWAAAGDHYERAVALAPDLAVAHHSRAAWFSTQGRHDEALASMERALALDPLSVVLHADAGWYLFVARRYEAAVARCREALALEPDHRGALGYLLRALLALGRDAEAGDVALALLRREGARDPALAAAAAAPAAERVATLFRHRLAREREREAAGEASPHRLAHALLDAGAPAAEVLDGLEAAWDEPGNWLVPFLAVYPPLDPLRDEPRFRALIARLHLP